MEQADFVDLLGAIFEETPGVAMQAWSARPFQDVLDLHQKMVAVVCDRMTAAEQVKLIQAHPELGKRGKMAEASVQEQAGAGLSALDERDYQRLESLNSTYREKFEFPFVMAVKGFDQNDILTAFEARLDNDEPAERARSLSEIYKIAWLRLNDLIR